MEIRCDFWPWSWCRSQSPALLSFSARDDVVVDCGNSCWQRGSAIASWLLDRAAVELLKSTNLANLAQRVSEWGDGRWTIAAAIDESIPTPVLSAALYERFGSRGDADFADKVLSALLYEFGDHQEKAAATKGIAL